jgi:hypothetical protein
MVSNFFSQVSGPVSLLADAGLLSWMDDVRMEAVKLTERVSEKLPAAKGDVTGAF